MFHVRHPKSLTVNKSGAAAGAVLAGCGTQNQGLRLRVAEGQKKGADGPLVGRFVILDEGDNAHSESLVTLLHRNTDADEVIALLRRRSPACVNVANTNILVVELATHSGRSYE